jgi:hypothetical protein
MIVDLSAQIIAEKEKKTLNKPFRTPKGPKKFSVYVKNDKGNVVKVNFGDPNMEIKRDDPARRKSFRARHNCANPGPKWKARYWSCRQWRAGNKVEGSEQEYEWDGVIAFDHNELLTIHRALAFIDDPDEEDEEKEGDCGCGTGCGCEESEAKATPKEYIFNNPGEAMKKAKELGLKGIHKHGEGDDTVFMPGPSHKALMDKLESKASEDYDMTTEEALKSLGLEDILAARPGPKSGAQTPSKPNEKKKGSSKNKPGSAGEKGGKITFSEKVLTSLKNKVKEHNGKHKKKVTLGQLKKVYRRGAGAFSQSHRPGMTRGGWAMARVNMFLKMKSGGKVKKSYRNADGDI